MLSLKRAPTPKLDMYGVIANRAFSIALRLGIFETLQEGGLTSTEVTHKLKASERGITSYWMLSRPSAISNQQSAFSFTMEL